MVTILTTINIIMIFLLGYSLMFFGQLYIYQYFTTAVYALIYLGVCLIFDNEIMTMCEKLGFLKKTSRVLKFYLLFFVIGLYVTATIVFSGIDDVWIENQQWLINAIKVSTIHSVYQCYRMKIKIATRRLKIITQWHIWVTKIFRTTCQVYFS